jgi:hypothetical protein
MDLKGLEPAFIEQQTLEGLERLCRGLFAFVPQHLRGKYPKYKETLERDHDLVDFGPAPGDILSVHLALEAFYALNKSFRAFRDVRNREAGFEFFRRTSLTVCKLGGEASPGDIEFYFEQHLKSASGQLAQARRAAADAIPPQWVLDQACEAMERAQRLELLQAPQVIINNQYNIWGGRGELTLEQRASFSLKRRVAQFEEEVAKLEGIIAGLQSGNLLPAMLELGEYLEIAAGSFEIDKSTYFDEEADNFLQKDGTLSVFVRTTSKGSEFDFEGVDYYLYRSLLNALQPNVGRA